METKKILLTPDKARELLATNYEGQRNVNNSWVWQLAEDIIEGRWIEDMPNSSILICKSGRMLDGQHRCLAVIKANRAVWTNITYGVDERIFCNVDMVNPRKVSDFLEGKNRDVIASIAKSCVCLERGATLSSAIEGRYSATPSGTNDTGKGHLQPSRLQVLQFCDKEKVKIAETASTARKIYNANNRSGGGGIATPASIALSMWIINYIDGDEALSRLFFEDFGADIQSSPACAKAIKTLYQMRVQVSAKRAHYTKKDYISVILAAYDKFKQGKELFPRDIKNALKTWQKKLEIKRISE